MVYFKHVTLVKAEVEYFDVSFFEANIALCYLGAMIKDIVESVTMPVDMRIDLDPYEKFKKHLESHECDLVAISTMTASFPTALRLARIAKSFGKYVVVGGYHPSAIPERVLAHEDIDAVIRGEGELSFRDFVLKGPSPEIKGLSYKDENGNVHHNPDREHVKDLDRLPFPMRELRPDNPIFKKHDVIVTSRGCNGACTFCANDAVHGRWRGRSPENVVAELELLHEKNPDLDIHIWDANFMQDPERVEAIIRLVKEKGINFTYFCEMRVDHIVKHPRVIKGLAEIGMKWVAIGIESPNQDRLKRIKKGITTTLVEKAVAILKQNRIKVVGYMMIGDPEETKEQMKAYADYATSLGIDKIMLAIQTPHPGSLIFKEAEEKGEITSYQWEKYDIGHSVAKLKHMTNHECELIMEWNWGRFYSPVWAFTRDNFFNNKKWERPPGVYSLREGVYLYLAYAWIGYPIFFMHARERETLEENLFSYVSAMKGHYDLGGYTFSDGHYLDIFRNCDFQLTFRFSSGREISVVARVDGQRRLSFDIMDGRISNVMFDFVLEARDYIEVIRSLPVQIPSLVNWGGYNLDNMDANIRMFRSFATLMAKAARINTLKPGRFLDYLVVGSRFFTRRAFDLVSEEFRQLFGGKPRKKTGEGLRALLPATTGIRKAGKDLLYKMIMLPFAMVVPVD